MRQPWRYPSASRVLSSSSLTQRAPVRYWRLHRDILDGRARQRYLVGQLRNGLGNRQQQARSGGSGRKDHHHALTALSRAPLLQAAAYLLLAMATQRALLLDHSDNNALTLSSDQSNHTVQAATPTPTSLATANIPL